VCLRALYYIGRKTKLTLKGFKYMLFVMGILIIFVLLPVITIDMWKPYEMYCLARLDTYLKVPDWCMDTFPSVYGHIQGVYWDVGLFSFFQRHWYLFVTSLFTNQLFIYVLYRIVKSQGLTCFFTYGLSKTLER